MNVTTKGIGTDSEMSELEMKVKCGIENEKGSAIEDVGLKTCVQCAKNASWKPIIHVLRTWGVVIGCVVKMHTIRNAPYPM